MMREYLRVERAVLAQVLGPPTYSRVAGAGLWLVGEVEWWWAGGGVQEMVELSVEL